MSQALEDKIIIRIIKSAVREDLIALYKDAGWWKPEYENDLGFLDSITKDSAVFAGAFINEKMIGMGRALSDMASDAYIQDVTVLKTYRGKGVGKKIVQQLLSNLTANGVDWIGVVGEPGTETFYKKLGFDRLKDYIPLKYSG